MKHLKTIINLVIFVLSLIFAFQNTSAVDINLLGLNISQVPLFIVIITIFIIGFILGRVTGWLSYLFDSKKSDKEN